ncbi:MAG TPA: hypothetical protein H9861_00115 [Candidatus Ligilactobacillus excrementigallinarum]|uniref:Thioesterase domain-containing protein n=1 Tax=Candidatus Ligilactobacillus excrementigallinarum TaxID=2838641 RepID=A0A9D2A902_9LACO|nr:hypothetical protein [Candidatus Ligilactobacillus excrementigallinarum]
MFLVFFCIRIKYLICFEFLFLCMIKFNSFNNFNIVLIHPAGGTTYCFNKLVKYINKANVYTVSCPKRYGEKGIDYLALLYKKELEAMGLLNKSTILVGYSFGGNVALKIAEDFHMLKVLWLIDTYPPESYTISNLDNKAYQRVFPEIWLSMTGKLEKLTPQLHEIMYLITEFQKYRKQI